MKRILVVGIGTGSIEHLTVEAINALNRADAIFILDKGEATADMSPPATWFISGRLR